MIAELVKNRSEPTKNHFCSKQSLSEEDLNEQGSFFGRTSKLGFIRQCAFRTRVFPYIN